MRPWYDYNIGVHCDAAAEFLAKDHSPTEHKISMGGYKTQQGYQSPSDFFDTFYFGSNQRYRLYGEYLGSRVIKTQQGLSIASGRCVPELYLASQGYSIICSDLEYYCKEQTKKIFPDAGFVLYDVSSGPFEKSVDYICCFSLCYLFDKDQFVRVLKNMAASLNPGGNLFLDPGGARDHIVSWLIDEFLCKAQAYCRWAFKRLLRNEKRSVIKKHHGYRITDEEIIALASEAGLKIKDICRMDYITELKGRCLFLRWIPDAVVGVLGRSVPYIRLFHFQKEE